MHFLLWPFSIVFQSLVFLRNRFFDWGLFSSQKISRPIVSVGNISVGGTGKTPWVIYLVEKMTAMGYSVGVVSRGYGGSYEGTLRVEKSTSPDLCGDEPHLIHTNTGVPVYVGKNRSQAANHLLAEHPSVNILVLDDGFQHRWIRRDLDLVVFDVSWSLSKYFLLPMGRLRESFGALSRADWVIFNKWEQGSELQKDFLRKKVGKNFKKQRLLISDYVVEKVVSLWGDGVLELDNESIVLACGLAHPEGFLASIQGLGIQPTASYFYKDHCPWGPHEIEDLLDKVRKKSSHDIVVTEKDSVKMSSHQALFAAEKVRVWVAPLSLKVIQGENELENNLRSIHETGAL